VINMRSEQNLKPEDVFMFSGIAIYDVKIQPEEILLGIGYWDRIRSLHTSEIKNQTKGGVARINNQGHMVASSPCFSNIVYSLVPFNKRVFIGCRNGYACILDRDMQIIQEIESDCHGIYLSLRDTTNANRIISTLRQGLLMFYDVVTGDVEKRQLIDPETRMWSLTQNSTNGDVLVGSYRGDVILTDYDGNVIQRINLGRTSIWVAEYLEGSEGKYIVGNARGEIYSLDSNVITQTLLDRVGPVTSSKRLSDCLLALGHFNGDITILDLYGNRVAKYEYQGQERPYNTIWSMDYREGVGLLAGFSNGQVRKFNLSGVFR